MSKRITTIVAILAMLVGLLWTLQGSNVLGGSMMSGQSMWLYIGIALIVVAGAVLTWTTLRR